MVTIIRTSYLPTEYWNSARKRASSSHNKHGKGGQIWKVGWSGGGGHPVALTGLWGFHRICSVFSLLPWKWDFLKDGKAPDPSSKLQPPPHPHCGMTLCASAGRSAPGRNVSWDRCITPARCGRAYGKIFIPVSAHSAAADITGWWPPSTGRHPSIKKVVAGKRNTELMLADNEMKTDTRQEEDAKDNVYTSWRVSSSMWTQILNPHVWLFSYLIKWKRVLSHFRSILVGFRLVKNCLHQKKKNSKKLSYTSLQYIQFSTFHVC